MKEFMNFLKLKSRNSNLKRMFVNVDMKKDIMMEKE